MRFSSKSLLLAVLVVFLAGSSALAVPITWNTWNSSADGTMGSVSVTFDNGAALNQLISNYPSYAPSSTFADGSIVDNAPTLANNIIRLSGGTPTGGSPEVNVVTFSVPVVDPVFAIWSLGQSGIQASFDFIGATPILVAGGVSAEYGGGSILIDENRVLGNEGNGTVQFLGTYSSLSWTNPTYEYWYGFNVGMTGTEPAPVPEPGTLLLLCAGLGGLLVYRRKTRI